MKNKLNALCLNVGEFCGLIVGYVVELESRVARFGLVAL